MFGSDNATSAEIVVAGTDEEIKLIGSDTETVEVVDGWTDKEDNDDDDEVTDGPTDQDDDDDDGGPSPCLERQSIGVSVIPYEPPMV